MSKKIIKSATYLVLGTSVLCGISGETGFAIAGVSIFLTGLYSGVVDV